MIQSRLLRRVGLLLALGAAYFIAGKLGLRLAFVNASATAVWPPTGIALVAFVLLGYDVWPAILASAFLVNLTTTGSVTTSIGIAVGNTLEGVVGAYLVNQFARGRRAFDRAQDVFAFATLAAGVSTTVSATLGVTTLSLAGFARWSDYGPIWSTWWLGDAVGDLVVAPAVMLWAVAPRIRWNRAQLIEAVALLLWVIVVGLAVSDPLTGLANYRQLTYAIDAEIKRYDRTERSFALVFVDLDRLKAINDRYGHPVGSLALCRVAETLFGSCRAMDTAARFGGDEFAVVLPETGDAAAWHVARRVAERVARDGEKPPLSVSIGVAVYPQDGDSMEALLSAADRSLYDSKARRRAKARVR